MFLFPTSRHGTIAQQWWASNLYTACERPFCSLIHFASSSWTSGMWWFVICGWMYARRLNTRCTQHTSETFSSTSAFSFAPLYSSSVKVLAKHCCMGVLRKAVFCCCAWGRRSFVAVFEEGGLLLVCLRKAVFCCCVWGRRSFVAVFEEGGLLLLCCAMSCRPCMAGSKGNTW